MEQTVFIKYLREEGHETSDELVEHSGDKALSYPILMSAIGCDSFAWDEKALKIRDAEEDRQISKLILASKQHSKHHPMLQFETLLRSSALLRQQYYMASLKFFICNFGTGDQSPTN
jgi:hypothetical protein